MLKRSGSFEKKGANAFERWTFIVSRSSNIYRIYINFDNLTLWNSSFIPYSVWKCFALFVIFQFYFVLIFRFLFVSSWMFPPAVEIVLHNVDAMLCENPTRKIVKAQFIIDEVLGKIFAISCQIRNSDAVLSLSVVEMVCLFPLGVWLACFFYILVRPESNKLYDCLLLLMKSASQSRRFGETLVFCLADPFQ